MAERKFEIVSETPDEPAESRTDAMAASMLALGLKTLSQRAVAATRDVFTLLSVGTVFWLWNNTPEPTYTQIVSLTIYAVMILAANVIVRRV